MQDMLRTRNLAAALVASAGLLLATAAVGGTVAR